MSEIPEQPWTPPIVPGSPQPPSPPPAPPTSPAATPPKRRNGRLILAAAAAVLAIGTGTAAAVVAYTADDADEGTATAPEANPFETAVDTCNLDRRAGVDIKDDGATLIIDNTGQEDSVGVDRAGLKCLIGALDAPASVTGRMYATRALDGRQEGGWGRFSASWTYHPDAGLDVIVTLKSGS